MGTCRAAARTVANPSDWPKCPFYGVLAVWGAPVGNTSG